MNRTIKENWFKIALLIILLFVAIPVFYYFAIYSPKREQSLVEIEKQKQIVSEQESQKRLELEQENQNRLEKENQQKLEQENAKKEEADYKTELAKANLQNCLADAYSKYNSEWALDCKNYSAYMIAVCNTNWISKGYGDLNDCIAKAGYPDISGSSKCNLPTNARNYHDSRLKESKDECYKLYPQQ